MSAKLSLKKLFKRRRSSSSTHGKSSLSKKELALLITVPSSNNSSMPLMEESSNLSWTAKEEEDDHHMVLSLKSRPFTSVPEDSDVTYETTTASESSDSDSDVEDEVVTKVEPKQDVHKQEDQDRPVLSSAPPPVHTMVLIVGLTAYFVSSLPSLASLDQVANMETFMHVNFDSLPLPVVIAVRLGLAAIMLGNALTVYLWGTWEADTDYIPGTKLHVARRIPFRGALTPEGNVWSGFKCISPFTLWSWILEGSAFWMAGMIPLAGIVAPAFTAALLQQYPWICRVAIVAWEIAASVSILVSAVVKYVLWPMAMQQGDNIKILNNRSALMQHNLNTIAALIEVAFLGGLPVRSEDFALPCLYGIAYLMFSYAMMHKWCTPEQDKQYGPQFVYPFFDTTLGWISSASLIVLLLVLTASFAMFTAAGHVLAHPEDFVGLVPAAAIVLLFHAVCRVKD